MALTVDVALEVFGAEGSEFADFASLRIVLSLAKVPTRVQVSVLDRLIAAEDLANIASPRLVHSFVVDFADFACLFAVNCLLNMALLHSRDLQDP